jgi:hypothetical protein
MSYRKAILILVVIILCYCSIFIFPKFFSVSTSTAIISNAQNKQATSSSILNEEKKKEVIHLPTPVPVKAIYMSACVASTPSLRDNLTKLVVDTEINSIVIDVKDYSGTISFDTGKNLAGEKASGCKINDLDVFLKKLKENNIYTIARITVFQDPYYAQKVDESVAVQDIKGGIWKDKKGLSFIDPAAESYWKYIIDISEASYEIGFDELNFDYIRFPSDGDLKSMVFPFSKDLLDKDQPNPKSLVMKNFFKYLNEKLKAKGITLSADIFGLVTSAKDDLNIGQTLEDILPYFDYVSPMVYPSHYYAHFNGWPDPNKVPYEIVNYAMKEAARRTNEYKNASTTPEKESKVINVKQLRPWLQDFDYGGDYGEEEIRAQMKAVYDAGLDSWMLWDPSNRYTKEALDK